MTLLLIVANIAAAFALVWNPELIERFGFDASRPELWPALTSLFLHANTIHLLANMVFLAAVGPAVEHGGGAVRLIAAYLVGGLAGVGAHWALAARDADSATLVGASGAIAACIALITVKYFRVRVPLAPGISASVAAVATLWVLLQTLGGFVRIGGFEGGAAYWAHVGGFTAGLLLSLVFRASLDLSVQIGHEALEQMKDRSPGAVAAAAEQHLDHHPEDLDALWKLAQAQGHLGDHDAEATTLIRILDVLPESQQPEVLVPMGRCGGLGRLPSIRRMLLADRLRSSHPKLAIELLESVISESDEDNQRPEALFALASIRRESDPEPAKALVVELLDRYPLHPAADLARAKGLSE